MKTYRRIEIRQGYAQVTDVDEAGNYKTHAVWPDGIVTSYYKTTLEAMGWRSLRSFLANRPGFILVEQQRAFF